MSLNGDDSLKDVEYPEPTNAKASREGGPGAQPKLEMDIL
jgi:hypothetical protein